MVGLGYSCDVVALGPRYAFAMSVMRFSAALGQIVVAGCVLLVPMFLVTQCHFFVIYVERKIFGKINLLRPPHRKIQKANFVT